MKPRKTWYYKKEVYLFPPSFLLNCITIFLILGIMRPFLNRYFLYTVFVLFSVFFGFFIFLEEVSYLMNGMKLNYAKNEKLLDDIRGFQPHQDIVYYDLYTDNSLMKYVSNKVSFDDVSYKPENLVPIYSDYVTDKKWNTQLLRKEANEALQVLARDFFISFEEPIEVVSAYRSYLYQKWIKDRGCPDNLCAKAWYSEHQSGLAVDFFEASTSAQWEANKTLSLYFEWLTNNAYKYGFINTYQKWQEIDGYDKEPWHWRYVGRELAEYIYGNNITFAEFYYGETK